MSKHDLHREADLNTDVRVRLKNLAESALLTYRLADEGIKNAQDEHLEEICSKDWRNRLEKIYQECNTTPEVEISLVGGTGAGKSTLVNALLDARLLPVSNMKACTAAISEVRFFEDKRYLARVEFISREEWQHEVELLIADMEDGKTTQQMGTTAPSHQTRADHPLGSPDSHDALVGSALSRAAMERLSAVYGLDKATPLSPENVKQLKEPSEITWAFDTCVHDFHYADFEAFRKQLAHFLDSGHNFWPIVKTVRIAGPFKALKNGVKLVDLPGINDPNEAREAITREHLYTAT